MNRSLFYILVFLFLQSCDYFTIKNDTRIPVARVYDTYLYEDEFTHIFGKDLNVQDSTLLAQSYINNWVKQQLLLSKAQLNLIDRTNEFDILVNKYRQDLYINSYKEAVVREYLNTVISGDDIDIFYNNNSQNFKLNEELIQVKYIKLAKDLNNKNELIRLFRSNKKADLDSLKAKEFSLNSHHLNDSIWVKYSELINTVNVFRDVDKKQLLKNNNFIQKEDSLSLYLMKIKKVLQRNEVAPKSYVIPSIKQMILHQRKLLLIRNIEETLIEDANKEQQFEIY